MARLNEVLGGILKDVTVARVTADLQTRDLYDSYREHPLLSRMPLPRITVRDLTLRLRFAIAEHEEPDYGKLDLGTVAQLWTDRLRRRILPRVIERAAGGEAPDSAVVDRLAAKVTASARTLSLSKALTGDATGMVTASVRVMTTARARLPARDRRELPAVTALRAAAEAEIRQEVAEFVPQARRQLAAMAAAEMDLQVLVRHADLATVDESRVQEITLTLTSDDVQLVAPFPQAGDTAARKGGGGAD